MVCSFYLYTCWSRETMNCNLYLTDPKNNCHHDSNHCPLPIDKYCAGQVCSCNSLVFASLQFSLPAVGFKSILRGCFTGQNNDIGDTRAATWILSSTFILFIVMLLFHKQCFQQSKRETTKNKNQAQPSLLWKRWECPRTSPLVLVRATSTSVKSFSSLRSTILYSNETSPSVFSLNVHNLLLWLLLVV